MTALLAVDGLRAGYGASTVLDDLTSSAVMPRVGMTGEARLQLRDSANRSLASMLVTWRVFISSRNAVTVSESGTSR